MIVSQKELYKENIRVNERKSKRHQSNILREMAVRMGEEEEKKSIMI